jgi:hypothetical protein
VGAPDEIFAEAVKPIAREMLDLLHHYDYEGTGVVTEVNKILGADDDPTGVAAWWVQPNGFLGGEAPKTLIPSGADGARVLTLAHDVAEWSG